MRSWAGVRFAAGVIGSGWVEAGRVAVVDVTDQGLVAEDAGPGRLATGGVHQSLGGRVFVVDRFMSRLGRCIARHVMLLFRPGGFAGRKTSQAIDPHVVDCAFASIDDVGLCALTTSVTSVGSYHVRGRLCSWCDAAARGGARQSD